MTDTSVWVPPTASSLGLAQMHFTCYSFHPATADCFCSKHSTALWAPCLLTQMLSFPPLILNFNFFIFYRSSAHVVNCFYDYLYVSIFSAVGTREHAEGLVLLASSLYSARQFLSCQLKHIAFLFKTKK